jgi:hypothetical protein
VRLVTGHSPVKGNSPDLSSDVSDGSWHWLLTWGLEHPLALAREEGNCNTVCVSFNLHWHSSGWPPRKTMMQSYYIITLHKAVCTLCRQLSRLPNHTRVRCPSWSYDLIYDIVRVWPDSYQECNASLPHLHERDNHRDSWQSLPSTFKCRLASVCMQSIRNVRRKAHCYQNHRNEIWVRMRNIPRSFYKEVTLFWQWEGQALAAKQSAILTSDERSEILLCFYDTYLLLYT